MSWQSKYNAEFTKPLMRQLMAIIQRDQRDALDFVGGEDNLPSFAHYLLTPAALQQFPAIVVSPERTVFDSESNQSRHYTTRVYIAVAAAHQDSQVCAELVQDYVRAVDAILNTLPLSDFYLQLPLSLPHFGTSETGEPIPGAMYTSGIMPSSKIMELFVSSHVYDEIQRARNSFATVAVLEVLIESEEM